MKEEEIKLLDLPIAPRYQEAISKLKELEQAWWGDLQPAWIRDAHEVREFAKAILELLIKENK